MTLMTIGYEGLDITSFLAELKRNRVATLIDVRELPLSRKKGFSKTALARSAENAGLTYLHQPALGCPKPIRKNYYVDKDWARYTNRFNAHLRTQRDILATLLIRAKRENCCLMCFEADYRFCHRSLITAVLAQSGEVSIKHLNVSSQRQLEGSRSAAA